MNYTLRALIVSRHKYALNCVPNSLVNLDLFTFLFVRITDYHKCLLIPAFLPAGYVALGDQFYPANRVDSPGTDLYYKAACVREDLTVQCTPGAKIWDDSRSFAWSDVSTWASLGPDNTLSGFVHANGAHEHPPNVTFHCLKNSAFKLV